MKTKTLEEKLTEERRAELEQYPNVTGTAVGLKQVDGEGMTDELSVIVYVSEKVDEDDLDETDVVPKEIEIDGETYKTDVQPVGVIKFLSAVEEPTPVREETRSGDAALAGVPKSLSRRERWRPASAGVSVGHPDVTAGTLGTPPLTTESGKTVFLTNSHVAADSGRASVGDEILQPGRFDGGRLPDDSIGTLLEFSSFSTTVPNTTDSALVEITPDHVTDDVFELRGDLRGWEETTVGQTYVKSGRTTSVTKGRCAARGANISIEGSLFVGVDVFEPMSAGGDSGSVIVRESGNDLYGVSLLFAGAFSAEGIPLHTFGIPMEAVQAEHGRLTPVGAKDVVRPDDLRIVGTHYEGQIDAGESQRLFTSGWPADEVVHWTAYPTTEDGRLTSSVAIERGPDERVTYRITVRNVGAVASDYDLRYARFG